MRTLKFSILCFFATAALAFCANMVKNPNFTELAKDGVHPAVWYPCSGWAKADPQTGICKDVVPPGSKGASFRIVGPDYLHQNSVKVTPGKSYRFSCRIKTENLPWKTTARFQICWYGPKGYIMKEYPPSKPGGKPSMGWDHQYRQIFGTVDWKEYVIDSFTAPAEARFAIIRIGKVGQGGVCYFSDVTMEECKSADAFQNRVATIPYGKNPGQGALLEDFLVTTSNIPSSFPTQVRICHDEQAIRLKAMCIQPSIGNDQFDAAHNKNIQDSFEVFFLPRAGGRQFQLYISPNGTYQCYSEDWIKCHWPLDMKKVSHPGVKVTVSVEGGRWMVDAEIPYAAIGAEKAPADGEIWPASFCRHVATAGKEFSSWSRLPTAAFQNTYYFGKVRFQKGGVIADQLRLSATGMCARLRNTAKTAQKVSLTMVKHSDKEAAVLAEEVVTLAPGEEKDGQLSGKFAVPQGQLLWSEVRAGDGTLLAKHCTQPKTTFVNFSFFDPDKVRGQDVYIATDHPFFIAWFMQHNLPSPHDKARLYRSEKAVDFIMEVPAGLKFSGLMYDASAYQWNQYPTVVPRTEAFQKNGEAWTRVRFALPVLLDWSAPNYLFFYTCSLPAGKSYQVPCWFEMDGRAFSRTTKTFRTIQVGTVKKAFDRIPFNVGLMDAWTLRTWFPQDTLRHYRALGFNCLSIPIAKRRNKEFYKGNAPKTREDHFDLLYQEIQEKKLPFFMNTLEITTGFAAHAWTRKEPDMVGLKKDGTPASNSEYGAPPLCFTYRGKHYQEWIDAFLNSTAFDKYRITWLALDMELWRKYMFDEMCYCDRCLKAFREFCLKKGWKEMADVNPKTAASPEFTKAWAAFQTAMCADFLTVAGNAVREKVKNEKQTNPWGRFIMEDYGQPGPHCPKECMDFFAISLYFTPDGIYNKFYNLRREHGMNADIFGCWLSYGQTGGCPDWQVTPLQCKENIFEAAIFGAKCITYYYDLYLNPLRMKYIVEAINTLAPVENILTEGRIREDARASRKDLLLTLRERKDEALLAVRSYPAREEAVEGTITLPAAKMARQVLDCETGKVIATLAKGQNSFTYKMPKNRCHLLYVGTVAQWTARRK